MKSILARTKRVATMGIVALVVLAGPAMAPGMARADKRNTVWTYEAKTMPAKSAELEYYLTAETKRVAPSRDATGNLELDDDGNPVRPDWGFATKWKHQVEVEVGVTDRFDLAAYTMFSHAGGSATSWDGYKLRARVMPAYRGVWPIDLMFYVEWIQGVDYFAFEEKIVLQRNFGNLFLVLNATAEQKGEDWGQEWVFEFAPTFAVGYEVSPHIAVSLETLYKVEYEDKAWSDHGFWLGPTVSAAVGPVFLAVGGMYQPTHSLDFSRFQVRAILGVSL